MGYSSNVPDMVLRYFTNFSKIGLGRFIKFRNMSIGGVGNMTSLTEISVMRVGGVLSHQNLASLLLVPKMLTVLDLPAFKGVSLICGPN